ncbi:MAG: O-antigen ligase family protein [Bacteroidales bacterium]|nr:O-antigen ligase family protein [Bacteroidales bacterium]
MTKKPLNQAQSLKSDSKRLQTAGLAIAAFLIIANGFAIIREFTYIPMITVGIVGGYIVLFHTNIALCLTAFCTPLSVIFSSKDIHLGLSLPSEALMISLTILFFVRILYDLQIRKDYVRHPISIAIFIYLGWMLVTCFTSARPIVSFKYFASKIWFVTCCYWMFMQLADDGWKKIVWYFDSYAAGLVVVVLVTTVKHALSGFDEHYAHWVMSPFYNDHTAYGAALAFMIPITVGFAFLEGMKPPRRVFYVLVSAVLLTGFYLSFSRAAWLSLAAAIAVFIILKLRIKLSWIVGFGAIFGIVMLFYADDILYRMSRNSQDSSGNFVEHIQSMSNISTDASNMERINRWTAAFGMIKERPVFGWGPGTYQFEYASFQQAKYQTVISTDFGDGGNAHSEYINPCAESGIPGMLTVFALLVCVIFCGIKTYIHSNDRNGRTLSLVMTLSLVTYFTHGVFNNFLDTDKLSLLFWSAFAVIMVCNVKYRKETV